MFSLKYFIKIFAITLATVAVVFLGVMGYLALNQDSIAHKLAAVFKEQSAISFEYSDLNFSVTKQFPFASLVLQNFSAVYPNSNDTLLSIKELMLSINVLSLVNGDYYFSSIALNKGVFNYSQPKIDGLLKNFATDDGQKSDTNRIIRFDRILLKQVKVNYIAEEAPNSYNIKISKARVFVDFTDGCLNLQFKTAIQGVLPQRVGDDNQLELQAIVSKNGPTCAISSLMASYHGIKLYADGDYKLDTGSGQLNFRSNRLRLKELSRIFNIEQIRGGSLLMSGSLAFNLGNGPVYNISVKHSCSDVELNFNGNSVNFPKISGLTTITDNFRNQTTHISHFEAKQGSNSLSGSARLKGFDRMALLVDCGFNTDGIREFAALKRLTASGRIKFVATLLPFANETSFRLQGVKSTFSFSLSSLSFFPAAQDINGTMQIDKNAVAQISGFLNMKKFSAKLTVPDVVSCLNNRRIGTISSSLSSNYIDVDKLLDDINKISSNSGSTLNKPDYTVKCKSDTVMFSQRILRNVEGVFFPKGDTLCASNFSSNIYSGRICGNAQICNNRYQLSGFLYNINISDLFADNNSFGQTFITHENIMGRLNSMFNATLVFEKGKVDLDKILLDADFEILNGKLLGMNKVRKLEKWLNLNEVKSIDFCTLQNKICVSNGELQIPQMDIKSNVLSIMLDGKHRLDGSFEYHTRLNLSQLIAARFMNKNSVADFEHDAQNNHFINLIICGNPSDYQVKRDSKRAKEQVKANIKTESNVFKNLVKEEFGIKHDSTKIADTTSSSAFRFEWDD